MAHRPHLPHTPVVEYDEVAVMDTGDDGEGDGDGDVDIDSHVGPEEVAVGRTPGGRHHMRSLSDGGGTPQKFTPAQLAEQARRTSKDDSTISLPLRDSFSSSNSPSVPLAPPQQNQQQFNLPGSKPAPLSPKLDHSQTYSSPTNILPRRSRGLDFSRAATSLHHTTIAEQSSPDSSPTVGGRAMNIPSRRPGDFGAPEQTSNSLWSIMGNQERFHISSSLGSAANIVSDSSTSSDEDDIMDEDMDEPYLMTPQVIKSNPHAAQPGSGWPAGAGSPAVNSLLSFQQRQRPRKQPKKKERGGPFSMGCPPTPSAANLSRSPPTNPVPYGNMAKEMSSSHARRESISWAANQLNIAGSDSEDSPKTGVNVDGVLGPGADPQNRVVRRAVTRRSNLLPKSKNFARIRAALAEEGAPVESEFRRESEVIRQVREDIDFDPPRQVPQPASVTATTQSSPNMPIQDSLEDAVDDAMMVDSNALGLSGSLKHQAHRNSKGKMFWENFSETSSMGGSRTTPPPPGPPRGSSSGMSLDDMNMDSPFANSGPGGSNGGFIGSSSMPTTEQPLPPSVADVTRRLTKRRRDDDLDPVSFKRRAVSPGMSVQGSPIMQSPMQHAPWGSRPGSNGGDRGGRNDTPNSETSGSGNGNGNGGSGDKARAKGRIGLQGMVDTNDGITRLSIE
ncbi:hypothetical protein F5883DRAFT_488781 [Diaporthe sp. PMI_573]|nr:hypothetical protein F5883DRAFT_488781 [Diaporthaceae sp. PMI_573]